MTPKEKRVHINALTVLMPQLMEIENGFNPNEAIPWLAGALSMNALEGVIGAYCVAWMVKESEMEVDGER